MTRNAFKRVLVGLIIMAMVMQPVAPIVGSAAATSTSTDAPTDPAATGPGSDLLLETTDNTTDDNTTDSFEEPTSIWGTGPDAARIVFGAASGYLFKAEQIEAISNQERRNEMYYKLETQHESAESVLSLYENYVHDSRTVADAKARAEIGDAWADGLPESTARQNAISAVEKYYSRMMLGVLERYKAHQTQVEYTVNISSEDPDVRKDFLRAMSIATYEHDMINQTYITGWETLNTTLPNGTVVSYEAPKVHYQTWRDYDETDNVKTWEKDKNGTFTFDPFNESSFGRSVYPSEADLDGYTKKSSGWVEGRFQTQYLRSDGAVVSNDLFEPYRWNDAVSEIENSSQYLQNNINQSMDEVWTALDRGQIQSDDMIDPTLAWEERSGSSVENMSDYSLSLFTLAHLGINTADLNQTRKQVIAYRGLPAEAPRHEGETIAYSNATGTSPTLPTEIDTGVNLTATDNAVYEVRVHYNDSSTALVPRSEFFIPDYDSPDNTQTNVSIKDWSAPNVNKTVDYVSAKVLTNLTNPETATLWHNETVTGMLASAEMPPEDGKFLVNKTYHTAQVPGVQQIAVLDENGTLMETRGQITILSAYDAAGNEVENISWSEHDYATYDGGDIQQITDEMIDLQNQLIDLEEDLESGGGGGDTGDSSFNLNLPSFDLGELWGIPIWLIIVLVLAAVLIAGS